MDAKPGWQNRPGMPGRAFVVDARIALICGDELLACVEDDIWGLPGGALAEDEAPVPFILAGLREQFGLRITTARVLGLRSYPSANRPGATASFMAAILTPDEIKAIQTGSETPVWEMMALLHFINHPRAARHLQHRLAEFISD